MPLPNVHATAVIVADRGIVITGPSGSGKTHLALALVDALRLERRFARLVCDDQALAELVGGRWLATAPGPLSNLVEIHGLGPRNVDAERRAVIDLVVDLVPDGLAPRLQDAASIHVAVGPLPTLRLPQRNATAAVSAIKAYLRL